MIINMGTGMWLKTSYSTQNRPLCTLGVEYPNEIQLMEIWVTGDIIKQPEEEIE